MTSTVAVSATATAVATNSSSLFSAHDPLQNLASFSVRQCFGTTVQLVFDALHSRGEQTLSQLVAYLRKRLQLHHSNNDHQTNPPPAASAMAAAAGSTRHRQLGVVTPRTPSPTDKSSIRAALLVLLQHDIVTTRVQKHPTTPSHTSTTSNTTSIPTYHYSVNATHARRLFRYAKYVEFVKRVVLVNDDVAAGVLQVLLEAGRLRTMDWFIRAVKQRQMHQLVADPRYTVRQQVVEATHKLESLGFVVPAPPLFQEDDEDEGEFEFEGGDSQKPENSASPPSPKRSRLDTSAEESEDPALFALLQGSAHYKHAFPLDRVWKVNLPLFHSYLRAYQLGRMVAERYGHKVQSCGSLVTAALKFQAQRQHNPHERNRWPLSTHSSFGFSTNDLIKHIPKPVLQILEKKVGGLVRNLPKAFDDLIRIAVDPPVVRPLTDFSGADGPLRTAGGGEEGASVGGTARYEVCVSGLMSYLHERVLHQIVHDRSGPVAARVVSILTRLGYLESDALAERAMVPVKDVRETLHQLYKIRCVELIQLPGPGGSSSSGGHGNTVHLWGVHLSRLKTTLLEHAAHALYNLRLRRQSELDRGQLWVERARQAISGDGGDENEHAKDRLQYTQFCLGLERLDVATLQLDDTILILGNFQ